MMQANDHLESTTISAFVDGELSPIETQNVQQHIAACHACALQIISANQVKSATARAGSRYAPAADAMARLTAALKQPEFSAKPKEESPVRTAQVHTMPAAKRPSAWWAAIAASLLAIVSLMGWQQLRHTNTLSAELLDHHLSTLSSGGAPDVISTDRHTVKPWFQGKLPFSFNLPETLPADMVLKGADMTYVNGQPAAQLLFAIHKHEVSIFLTQRENRIAAATMPSNRSGFSIRTASTPEMNLIAVSDVNAADLETLLKALVAVQSPR